MPFPPDLKEDALVACGRCCCICHKFCGTKIEVHHIREESEGGDNSAGNAIPVCFDCHADMRSYDHKHPKGNKYGESELRTTQGQLVREGQGQHWASQSRCRRRDGQARLSTPRQGPAMGR